MSIDKPVTKKIHGWSRHLPPLNALKAFEAAARHLSFTRAALELNVTQAAISHQVRMLEAYLDQPLFIRQHQGLVLTEAAQLWLPSLEQAFDLIDKSSRKIRRQQAQRWRVAADVWSFGVWLQPCLGALLQTFPQLDWVSDQQREVDACLQTVLLTETQDSQCWGEQSCWLVGKVGLLQTAGERILHWGEDHALWAAWQPQLEPLQECQVLDRLALCQALQAGIGVALLPASVASELLQQTSLQGRPTELRVAWQWRTETEWPWLHELQQWLDGQKQYGRQQELALKSA